MLKLVKASPEPEVDRRPIAAATIDGWIVDAADAAFVLIPHVEAAEFSAHLYALIRQAEGWTGQVLRARETPPQAEPLEALDRLRERAELLMDLDAEQNKFGRFAAKLSTAIDARVRRSVRRGGLDEETRRFRERWKASDLPGPPDLRWEARRALVSGGIWNREQVLDASDGDLLRVQGVGSKTVSQLRSAIGGGVA